MNIVKTDTDAEHWPRLTKEKLKNQHIQIDWSKWVDEDEEDEAKPVGEDWDSNNMQGFGGAGGAGGFPGMGEGGFPGMGEGGFPGMGGMGGDSDDEEEEEEEGGHVHGENCDHGHDEGKTADKAAGLDDLDAEADPAQAQ